MEWRVTEPSRPVGCCSHRRATTERRGGCCGERQWIDAASLASREQSMSTAQALRAEIVVLAVSRELRTKAVVPLTEITAVGSS